MDFPYIPSWLQNAIHSFTLLTMYVRTSIRTNLSYHSRNTHLAQSQIHVYPSQSVMLASFQSHFPIQLRTVTILFHLMHVTPKPKPRSNKLPNPPFSTTIPKFFILYPSYIQFYRSFFCTFCTSWYDYYYTYILCKMSNECLFCDISN